MIEAPHGWELIGPSLEVTGMTATAMEYDPCGRASYWTETYDARLTLRRAASRWDGVIVRIGAVFTRLMWHPDGAGPINGPLTLQGLRLPIEVDSADSDTADVPNVLRAVGLSTLDDACHRIFAGMARHDPDRLAVGSRASGPKGEPELYYAQLVRDYLAAIEQHGERGFMRHLVESNPRQLKRTSILRNIDRAEQLGLITNRPGHGKAGGTMTPKCEHLLAESARDGGPTLPFLDLTGFTGWDPKEKS